MAVSGTKKMYCHDVKVMGSNPGRVETWVRSIFVLVVLEPNLFSCTDSAYRLSVGFWWNKKLFKLMLPLTRYREHIPN